MILSDFGMILSDFGMILSDFGMILSDFRMISAIFGKVKNPKNDFLRLPQVNNINLKRGGPCPAMEGSRFLRAPGPGSNLYVGSLDEHRTCGFTAP